MSALVLAGLRKVFDGTVVVDDVSLTVRAGELMALVGPSGCGKSTLLRLISGLIAPTAGQIQLDGRDVTSVPPAERDVAMVFQSYALYPHLSVRENIAFPLRVRRCAASEVRRKVEAVAMQLGLEALLERRPRELSGGQRQRVAIGRALVREPKVFLFDEPLSNLDAALRARMRGEIAALHRRLAVTTVYVTHDQHEAMTLADRLVLLNHGRVEQEGPPLLVYREPTSRFAGEFLGNPGMSFLPAVRQGEEVVCGAWRCALASLRCRGELPRELWLGVRPETLRCVDGPGLAVIADWVERAGAETYVYAHLEASSEPAALVLKLSADADVEVNARLVVVPGVVRLFDRQSGRWVAESPAPATR